jgi:GTP pyrophosphokinase
MTEIRPFTADEEIFQLADVGARSLLNKPVSVVLAAGESAGHPFPWGLFHSLVATGLADEGRAEEGNALMRAAASSTEATLDEKRPTQSETVSQDPAPYRVLTLSSRFDQGFLLAAELHRRHWRKGTSIPYLSHLLGVASLVLEHGGDEDEAIAALFHDAVEDQGGPPTLARIRAEFGDRIAGIVAGCTDADVDPKPPWRPRKEAYLAHLEVVDESTRLVSAADKLHNARAILADYRAMGERLWDRFTADRNGVLWYYRTLVEIFTRRGPRALAEELRHTVAELETLVIAAAPGSTEGGPEP